MSTAGQFSAAGAHLHASNRRQHVTLLTCHRKRLPCRSYYANHVLSNNFGADLVLATNQTGEHTCACMHSLNMRVAAVCHLPYCAGSDPTAAAAFAHCCCSCPPGVQTAPTQPEVHFCPFPPAEAAKLVDSGAAVAYVDDSANLKPAGDLAQIPGIPVLLPTPCEGTGVCGINAGLW